MSGKRNVLVCRGHELATALYMRLTVIFTDPRCSESEGSLPGRWLPVIKVKIIPLTVLQTNARKVCQAGLLS